MQVHVVTEELHYDGTTVVAVLSDRDEADALAVKLSDAATPSERKYTSWWVETFVLDAVPGDSSESVETMVDNWITDGRII